MFNDMGVGGRKVNLFPRHIPAFSPPIKNLEASKIAHNGHCLSAVPGLRYGVMRTEDSREISLLMTQMRRLCTMAVNKRLALVGSSMHVYAVLFRLVHDEEVPQQELAFDAAIDPAAVSRLIREMASAGLVSTRVDPTDKRQRFVKVTAKGRTLERTLRQIVDDALQPFMQGLTCAEEQEFLRLLRKAHQAVLTAAVESEEVPHVPARVRSSAAPQPSKPSSKRRAGA
jgi:DNA-binding MarR family transcriptional regulator